MLWLFLSLAFPSLRSCTDLEANCAEWAAAGECERNVGFMKTHACRASCGTCNLDTADLAPEAVRASAAEQAESIAQVTAMGFPEQVARE